MRRTWGLWLAVVWLAFANIAAAQDKEALRKLAMEVPIADVHLHLFPGLSPDELQARMDRNHVRWGGAVGPILPNIDPEPFVNRLGKRYIPAGAQPELASIFMAAGTAPMVDAESAWFKTFLPKMRQDLEQKKIQGLGELILNARNHLVPTFRRKVPIDAPTFAALFQLAEQHGAFIQLHMEDDGDSVSQLQGLLAKHPKVPVILSHCMVRASASSARAILEKFPNTYCETSARSNVLLSHPQAQPILIHTEGSPNSGWLSLIEAMPDRFMVGSDATAPHMSYDAMINAVRSGLLAHLSESTMRKVAYENAQRVLRLENP